MKYKTKETLLGYIYVIFGFAFAASLVLLAFMHSVTPFNTSISWSGSSLVLAHEKVDSAIGQIVAKDGPRQWQVMLYMASETYRKNGELVYQAIPISGSGGEEMISAREVQQSVIATIPALGIWVRALGYPIGILALVGIPLLTFALDMLMRAHSTGIVRTVRRTFINLERRREKRRLSRLEREMKEQPIEDEVVEVGGAPTNIGMTIHLSRPRRYGM